MRTTTARCGSRLLLWGGKRLPRMLFILPIVLSSAGLLFVFEASFVRSFSEYGDSFHYLKVQALWILLGVLAMSFFSFFDYHKLYFVAFHLMLATVFFLFLVLIPGIGIHVGGARRWLDFGFVRFQPSELAKFASIVYLASWFLTKERKRFSSFIVLLGLLMFLVIMQPDMGTAIILFSLSIVLYFLAGVDLRYLLLLVPASITGMVILAKAAPYRMRRIQAFFDPSADPLGVTYHINQIYISLANGGLLGRGFGASKQKHLFLPEAHTDSIFAIIGEELGFVGSLLLLCAMVWLIIYLYRVAECAPDRYGKLLAGGVFGFFGIQTILNLASMVGLVPLTGVPLPFISYGGSNLVLAFGLIGIAVNIAKQSRIEYK